MNIVNEIGVDHGIVLALKTDLYNKGGADFSATDLITPPRIFQLQARHGDEIQTEAADLVYILLGRTTHEMLEKVKLALSGDNHEARNQAVLNALEAWEAGAISLAEVPSAIKENVEAADTQAVLQKHNRYIEQRFFQRVELSNNDSFLISGAVDDFDIDNGILSDYKVCSVWSVMDVEPKPEWTQQLNIYAYLLRKNGHTVNKLQINAIFRDWSKQKARYAKDNYPLAQVQTIEIPLWSEEEAEKFVKQRIKLHVMCRDLSDENLPICSPEERWVKDRKFAVMKKGRVRAIKLTESNLEALQWIKENKREGEELYIEKRDGTSTRCVSYCPVAQFCEFGKLMISKELKEGN